jgi:hypothetical protein
MKVKVTKKNVPFNTFLFKHELQCQFRIIYNYRST